MYLDSHVLDEISPRNTTSEGDVTNMKTEQVFKINNVCFDDAKQSELISWKSNICQVVPNINQKYISLILVYTLKDNMNGLEPKARFFVLRI